VNEPIISSVLVTNDDGDTPWLRLTTDILLKLAGRVTTVIPQGDRTGCSAAISLNSPIEVRASEGPNHRGETWVTSGFPADGVRYAMRQICPHAELIVSGINNGWNLGFSTINSGTVGAAMEAARFGRSGLAISVAFATGYPSSEWQQCAEHAIGLLLRIKELRSCGPVVLNISLPVVFRGGRPQFRILPLSRVFYEEWYESDNLTTEVVILRGQRMIPDPFVPDLEELESGMIVINIIETAWASNLECLRAALAELP
jgi:5'-nucleotidase